jgi:hypothetical protein
MHVSLTCSLGIFLKTGGLVNNMEYWAIIKGDDIYKNSMIEVYIVFQSELKSTRSFAVGLALLTVLSKP